MYKTVQYVLASASERSLTEPFHRCRKMLLMRESFRRLPTKKTAILTDTDPPDMTTSLLYPLDRRR